MFHWFAFYRVRLTNIRVLRLRSAEWKSSLIQFKFLKLKKGVLNCGRSLVTVQSLDNGVSFLLGEHVHIKFTLAYRVNYLCQNLQSILITQTTNTGKLFPDFVFQLQKDGSSYEQKRINAFYLKITNPLVFIKSSHQIIIKLTNAQVQ